MKKSPEDKTSNRHFLNPPEVAVMLGVSHPKVLAFITSGELEAVNLASKLGSRPRWGISRESLDRFLMVRSNRTVPQPARRKPRDREVSDDRAADYF